MEKEGTVCASLVRYVFVTAIAFSIGSAHAQNSEASIPPGSWVGEPSQALASKLQQWRLRFELGVPTNAPEMGAFPSFTPGTRKDGTARLINQLRPSAPIALSPVAERTRYKPAWDPGTDPHDKVVTKEILDIFRSPEVASFVATQRVALPQLDIEKNFAVALVQDFDVALRAPKKKERVWSIYWRIDNEWIAARNEKREWTTTRNDHYVGYEGLGLFTRVDGALKPFRLAATKYKLGGRPYYYVLAVGDLDGDGIDELIVRRMEFEAEEDNLELWAWEHDGPVRLHKIP
jgi:hypothetical protein